MCLVCKNLDISLNVNLSWINTYPYVHTMLNDSYAYVFLHLATFSSLYPSCLNLLPICMLGSYVFKCVHSHICKYTHKDIYKHTCIYMYTRIHTDLNTCIMHTCYYSYFLDLLFLLV